VDEKFKSRLFCTHQVTVEQSLPPRFAKFALRWPGDRETKVFKLFLTNTANGVFDLKQAEQLRRFSFYRRCNYYDL
jgi:hypothetical protein